MDDGTLAGSERRDMLWRLGFEITEAASGEEVLPLCAARLRFASVPYVFHA